MKLCRSAWGLILFSIPARLASRRTILAAIVLPSDGHGIESLLRPAGRADSPDRPYPNIEANDALTQARHRSRSAIRALHLGPMSGRDDKNQIEVTNVTSQPIRLENVRLG